jgi:hypothetical protein
MAPCFSVPSSEAGGHTQYQPKSGIFKSAVLDHFHIGADSFPPSTVTLHLFRAFEVVPVRRFLKP